LLRELDNQKRAYHEKELSVDGEWTLFMRSFQVYDFTLDIASLLIPEFYMASMSVGLLYNVDLAEVEPFSIEFTWRMPTVEEWARGVGVVIERITPPYAVKPERFVDVNVREEYREGVKKLMIVKGYYGKTRYGYSYYDPAAMREFIRNAVQLMLKKHPSPVNRKVELLTLATSVGVTEDFARSTHDRMSIIMSSHTWCFTLNYSMLDVARLCEPAVHSEEQGVVPFVDLDGNVRTAEITALSDAQYACILDVGMLDYCLLSPGQDIYTPVPPPAIEAVAEKVDNFRRRWMITPVAFSNYVTGAEAADYTVSERTNVWGELMSIRYVVEHEVEAFLAREAPALNTFDRRKYVTAVLQLLGHTGKRHRWGYKVYQLMEESEIKNWWLEYWSSQGLDRTILEKLFESVKTWLPRIVDVKTSLGRRVRLRRLGIPID
jgi:hypothetical protein